MKRIRELTMLAHQDGYQAAMCVAAPYRERMQHEALQFQASEACDIAADALEADVQAALDAMRKALEVLEDHQPDWPPQRGDTPIMAQLRAALAKFD